MKFTVESPLSTGKSHRRFSFQLKMTGSENEEEEEEMNNLFLSDDSPRSNVNGDKKNNFSIQPLSVCCLLFHLIKI